MSQDVPSPIDLRDPHDAKEWERTALEKRPSRPRFFAAFEREIREHAQSISTILELGSGPGFLAEHLLTTLPHISYTALDFSSAMHDLARARLGDSANRVHFLVRDFRDEGWHADLGVFDCVVTHQAVHELRHKRHAQKLHEQVAKALSAGGIYLMCDHFAGECGMRDDQLYMTLEEQMNSLQEGGFEDPELIKTQDSLAMYRAHVTTS